LNELGSFRRDYCDSSQKDHEHDTPRRYLEPEPESSEGDHAGSEDGRHEATHSCVANREHRHVEAGDWEHDPHHCAPKLDQADQCKPHPEKPQRSVCFLYRRHGNPLGKGERNNYVDNIIASFI